MSSTSPAPWAEITPQLLAAGALTHTAVATINTTDGDAIPVPIVDGSLSFDETRSPRVELTLTMHLPADQALVDRIDPRRNTRVSLSVGYTHADGTADVQPIADLGLRSRSRARPNDELELTARSDEALVLDNAGSPSLAVNTPTTVAAIINVLNQALPTIGTIRQQTITVGAAVAFVEDNVDKWTAIADFADRVAAVVYDDGLRQWWIIDRPNTTAIAPSYTIADGAAGTMVDVTDDFDRDGDWANRVVLVYAWTDSAGKANQIVGWANASGPFAPTGDNLRAQLINRDTPTTQAAADAAAATLAARVVTRGRVYSLTAPSAYWVRPGDTIQIAEAGRDPVSALVSSIEFDLRDGLMRITTRQADNAATWNGITSSMDTWDQVPADVTWNTSG